MATALVLSWVGVAACKGDYTLTGAGPAMFWGARQAAMLRALAAAATTWALCVPTCLAVDAALCTHGLLSPAALVGAAPPSGTCPAQVEVLLACLVTLASWRGIYVGLKDML